MAKASSPTVRVGSPAEGLTLHLTLGDTYRLTRDGDTPVDDISYAGGVMRFLGVKVEKGGVPESVLVRDAG